MNYVELGQHIRAARRVQKLTQSDLAKQIGRSVSFLGHIERGSRKASIETLVVICDALNISTDDVLGRNYVSGDQVKSAANIEVLIATLEAALEIANRMRFENIEFL